MTKSKKIISLKDDKKLKSKGKNVPIKFKVHHELIEQFHILRMDYAKSQKIFSLSNNEAFTFMVEFMYYSFKEDNILKDCPEDFKTAIIRVGKRKTTERTVSFAYSDTILFTIKEDIADKYMDIMFSFILNNPKDNIYNTHHSRTYFFYDFIQFIKTNKKEFLNFSLSE